MNKQLLKQLKSLRLGDLIRVDWFDAAIGKSMAGGNIDVPVRSYGIYLGILGEKNKHIILAQNSFKFTNGIYDVDYTSIPLSWALTVNLIKQGEVSPEDGHALLHSFLLGRARALKRRVSNHGS